MGTIKVTAVTKKGHPIVSVYVSPEETLDAVIDIITDELTTSGLNKFYPLLDAWINGGRLIKMTSEFLDVKEN